MLNETFSVIFKHRALGLKSAFSREVLQRGGTAVDATIATLCCNGVISSQSLGIGGGFLMTVYHRKSGKATSIIARETAPAAATEDMFHGNAKLSSEVSFWLLATLPWDNFP